MSSQSDSQTVFKGITAGHEVLTEGGWVSIETVAPAEKLATLNSTNNKLEYITPSSWLVTPVNSEMFSLYSLRHNRAELTCGINTALICRYAKTGAWQNIECKKLLGVDFYQKNYLSEVLVKPINCKINQTPFFDNLYLPVNSNNSVLVRKNGKIFWVGC